MDLELDKGFLASKDPDVRHEISCAGMVNLLAYLGWLRGGEIFKARHDEMEIVQPKDGPVRGLPPGVGAIEYRLLPATKSDPTLSADVIIAFRTLSGLSLGKWANRLHEFQAQHPELLFSTRKMTVWTSRYFRETYSYPLLELQRLQGEPTLKSFSSLPGQRIRDKVWSMHSWRRGGRSKVSRAPRHNEPSPKGTQKATPTEIYEHGRWAHAPSAEDMPKRYNQWDLADRICLSLFCM
jgi:hypothetical protein